MPLKVRDISFEEIALTESCKVLDVGIFCMDVSGRLLITLTAPELQSVTYAKVLEGLNATAIGDPPTVIVLVTVFVATSITLTVSPLPQGGLDRGPALAT